MELLLCNYSYLSKNSLHSKFQLRTGRYVPTCRQLGLGSGRLVLAAGVRN